MASIGIQFVIVRSVLSKVGCMGMGYVSMYNIGGREGNKGI